MTYGTIKVDTVTFTDAGVDKSVTLSGLVQNPTFSGDVTVTGTLSGVTVTGTTANFTSGNFTNISGGTHTITSGVFAAGSEASPSITFAGYLNTGIYSPGADQVAISTSGTGRLFVDASGNVGVGVSPSAIFEAAGSEPVFGLNHHVTQYLTSTKAYNATPGGGIALRYKYNSANDYTYGAGISFEKDNTVDGDFGSHITIQTRPNNGSATECLRITSAGLVGIGTSEPGGLLHVSGGRTLLGSSDGYELAFARTGNYFYWYNDGGNLSGKLSLTTSTGAGGGEIITFTQDTKRVGIGTTDPQEELHIVAASQPYIQVQSTGGTAGSAYYGYNSSTGSASIESTGSIRFAIPGSEAALIDSSRRFLVGTSNGVGNNLLQVKGSTVGAGYPGGAFFNIGLNVASVDADFELGRIDFGNQEGYLGASIVAAADLDWNASDYPSRLVFSTTADGANSPTERMRITNAGQVNVYGSGTQGFLLTQFGSNYPARVYEAGAAGQNNAATQLNLHQNSATGRSINAAGTINASGADYAEYMVKASDFTIAKGAVCGVTADGLLTLNYADAVSFVVKSTNPSYVGGDTWGSEDVVGSKPEADDADALVQWEADLEASRQTVDRIAFAGQVPVNVMGATPGQYIVPVEAADGGIEGVAKNETDMTLAEYMRAVGKVIAIEDDGRARIIVKVA